MNTQPGSTEWYKQKAAELHQITRDLREFTWRGQLLNMEEDFLLAHAAETEKIIWGIWPSFSEKSTPLTMGLMEQFIKEMVKVHEQNLREPIVDYSKIKLPPWPEEQPPYIIFKSPPCQTFYKPKDELKYINPES